MTTVRAVRQLSPQPARATRLEDAIRRSLQGWIVEGALRPGDRLPGERELAGALGVGRPALREALRGLAEAGVIEIRHGVGAFLLAPQHPALTRLDQLPDAERLLRLRQASFARLLVETEVVTRAASRSIEPRAVIAALNGDAAEPQATRRRHRLDFSFERALVVALNDPFLDEMQRHAHRLFAAAWEAAGFIPRPAEERLAQHRAILSAVLARDVPRACREMARHLAIDARPSKAEEKGGTP
jgi:GntR family transcriptional repressor for pyruvate dehydrogenase complex